MKLLILHGPNMNLFGVRSSKKGDNITLDKINRHIRKFIRNKDIEIKIMQTHSESKAVGYLHRNRKAFDGLILTPGPWQYSGYILKDTLDLIELKSAIILLDKHTNSNLFSNNKIIINEDIFSSYEQAISYYVS
tara:strand:- start:7 stop:408 length:402 start_codon:yes stop_codon:yes gene_type:complete